MAGDCPPARIADVMLNSFLHHVNRIDDLTCREFSALVDARKPDFTVADLHQYMNEKTCPIVRAMVRQEQMRA